MTILPSLQNIPGTLSVPVIDYYYIAITSFSWGPDPRNVSNHIDVIDMDIRTTQVLP